jgi:hypothetical protein
MCIFMLPRRIRERLLSTLRNLATIATASGAAGFGAAGGRSLWRTTEKNALSIALIVLVVAGAGLLGYFVRKASHRPLGSFLLLAVVPTIAATVAVAWFLATKDGPPRDPEAVAALVGWQLAAFVLGVLFAEPARKRRVLTQAIDDHNEAFLQNVGIHSVGGNEDTWLDEQDRELVIADKRTDALIFRIKEKRGGRSRILLDADGRMTSYQPG